MRLQTISVIESMDFYFSVLTGVVDLAGASPNISLADFVFRLSRVDFRTSSLGATKDKSIVVYVEL